MSKDKRVLGKVGMALLLVFFYAPILFMIIFSFNSSKSLTHFTGFSLCWYEAMLKNHGMMESLYVTIIIALLATIFLQSLVRLRRLVYQSQRKYCVLLSVRSMIFQS